jgi:hypothetical protein
MSEVEWGDKPVCERVNSETASGARSVFPYTGTFPTVL